MSKKHEHPKQAPQPASTESAAPSLPTEAPPADATTERQPMSAAEIDALRAKAALADEAHTKYLYALAELENFRKRSAKERKDILAYAGQEILFDLLDVVDNIGRALDADRKETDPKVIVNGIELINRQLASLLEKFGVKPINAMGSVFDPKVHEALQRFPSADAQPGTILHELQKGFLYRDRVLRPARVVVADSLPTEPEPTPDDSK